MARSNNNGWDFIEVGKRYQYKEDSFIAMVTILENNSNTDQYVFKLRVEHSNYTPPQNGEFEIMSLRGAVGFYSGMIQLYNQPEYFGDYKWNREVVNPSNEEMPFYVNGAGYKIYYDADCRNPCTYCGGIHKDYACDEQISFFNTSNKNA